MYNDPDLPPVRGDYDDAARESDAADVTGTAPRFGRLALCVAAASALAFGVVGTVAYLLLLVLLLPRFGALGAAIATTITSAVIVTQLALSARQILRHGSVKASTPLVADPLAEADIAQG